MLSNRIFVLSLLITSQVIGQSPVVAKRMNEFLERHAYTSHSYLPQISLKRHELIVPYLWADDQLKAMSWKNIDSVLLYDTSGPEVNMIIYGKGFQYHKCEPDADCNTSYFNSLFYVESATESMLIKFFKFSGDHVQMFGEKERHELRRLLTGLGLHYRDFRDKYGPPKITLPTPAKDVFLPGHIGEVVIPATELQKATELRPIKSTLKIISFMFYVTGAGIYCFDPVDTAYRMPIKNPGQEFNKLLKYYLTLVGSGTTIIFDEIKAVDGRGQIIKLEPASFYAK